MPVSDLASGFKQFLSGVTKVDDIQDKEDRYEASFHVPGYSKQEINVFVEKNSLIVEGIKDKEAYEREKQQQQGKEPQKQDQDQKGEIKGKNFRWTYPVPPDVDENKIQGEVRDGVLQLKLGKKENPQDQRKDVKVK